MTITALQIIFILVAATTLGTALMVVTTRNLVHAALWLIASLFGVAILYAILQASFLAVVQIVVYIGAIAILMIFTIMLTRHSLLETGPRFNLNWRWALGIALVFFAGLFVTLAQWQGIYTPLEPLSRSADTVKDLGVALVSPDGFVLAFELASVLLLAALIGAIVVSWDGIRRQS
jgi:NADH-quinone oxidoreductase subunit J